MSKTPRIKNQLCSINHHCNISFAYLNVKGEQEIKCFNYLLVLLRYKLGNCAWVLGISMGRSIPKTIMKVRRKRDFTVFKSTHAPSPFARQENESTEKRGHKTSIRLTTVLPIHQMIPLSIPNPRPKDASHNFLTCIVIHQNLKEG